MTPQKRITYAEWLEQRRAQAARTAQGGGDEPTQEEQAAVEEVLSEPQRDPTALPAVEYFQAGNGFRIGDIAVTPFTIPHDAVDPVGFVLETEGVRLAIATDLGYIPSNVCVHLRGCDVLMLESNHDLDMLRDGPYPWSVKQRVMSRVGHLSNHATSEFLERSYDGRAAWVVLAHLSESNNLPELARISAERALRDRISLLANRLLLAEQNRPTEAIVME
jgi:phosphoribosyl 1,2-cyclic phosphodiesterase